MKDAVSKKVLPPRPEPITFGKCRVVSRSPILIPEGATSEQFDTKYGFYKYQPKSAFEVSNDIYPILKNDPNSNAFYLQTPNTLHLFVLKNGSLPIARNIKTVANQLVEKAKVSDKSTFTATYNRENYIFLEKTSSGKLLFVDKGTTTVQTLSSGTNSYYYLSLPIFVLSSPQFYQYKHEREYVYFLGDSGTYYDIKENNDDDGAVTIFRDSLPQFIEDMIVSGSCRIDNVAYPYYQGLKSDDINAPKARFSLVQYDAPNLSAIFEEQTGAFSMNQIERTQGNKYVVNYGFEAHNYAEIYKITGKIVIYGFNPEMSMLRVVQTPAYQSPLPTAWQGAVLRVNDSNIIRKEIFETCDDGGGDSGKPSGCPPA